MTHANAIQRSADCHRQWADAFRLQPTAVEGMRRDALCFTVQADADARSTRSVPPWHDVFALEAATVEARRVDALCFTVSPMFRATGASQAH